LHSYKEGNEEIAWGSCNSSHYEDHNIYGEYLPWEEYPQDGENCELELKLSKAIKIANLVRGMRKYRENHEGEYLVYASYEIKEGKIGSHTVLKRYEWNIAYGHPSGDCYSVVVSKIKGLYGFGIVRWMEMGHLVPPIQDKGQFKMENIIPRNELADKCLTLQGALNIWKKYVHQPFVGMEWAMSVKRPGDKETEHEKNWKVAWGESWHDIFRNRGYSVFNFLNIYYENGKVRGGITRPFNGGWNPSIPMRDRDSVHHLFPNLPAPFSVIQDLESRSHVDVIKI
jgi:hypothetical protein